MRRAAGRLNVRHCPSCSVPILKQGGCNNMNCGCGRRFSWLDAEPAVPCHHPHYEKDEDDAFLWGTTCRWCSPKAKAKLVASRSALVGLGTLAGGAALGIGAAAAAAGLALSISTAAAFAPLALAYEPVRRLRMTKAQRQKKHNPLAVAAASGAMLSAGGLYVCTMATCGYESD